MSMQSVFIGFCLIKINDLFIDCGSSMVWSDWGRVARLERADMDGTHRLILAVDNIVVVTRGL